MPKLSASPAAAHISFMRPRMWPSRGATSSGLRVPRSMASTWARSSIASGTSSGRPMLMTKSMLGSFSQRAACPSTSALRTRRRSRVSGSQTYSTSDPVPQ